MTLSTYSVFSLASAAILSGIANAHLMLDTPVPYGKDSLDNSPLVDAKPGSSGANYPCKLRTGGYEVSSENHIKAGEDQVLSFIGSASHGGGTCQLALSTSRTPTPTDTFKAFQIYEGGCPISGDGNDGTSNFTYSIPTGIKNGEYSLAWTWYNRIGNREIYMNCAPVTVTGGSDSMDFYDSLPNMYVINLPTSECSSVESSNQLIPNPGNAAMKKDSTYPIAAASGPSCAASAAAMTKGVSGGSNSSPATSAPASSATAPASSAPAGYGGSATSNTSSAPAGGEIGSSAYGSGASSFMTISTVAASSPAASTAYPTMAPSSAGVSAPAGYPAATGAASSGPSNGSSSGSAGDDGITCSSDGKQFGQAVAGSTVWRAVAAGTSCQGGQIVKRSSMRHAHVRRAGHV